MTLTLAQIIPFWATAVLVAVFLFISVLMILAVLIQRPAGGGLSGAFGSGAGSGQTAFGAKTGDALTIATIIVFVIYILFAIGLNFAARPAEAPGPVDELAGVAADPVPDTPPGGAFSPAPERQPDPPVPFSPGTPPEPTPTEPPAEQPAQPLPEPQPEQPGTGG